MAGSTASDDSSAQRETTSGPRPTTHRHFRKVRQLPLLALACLNLTGVIVGLALLFILGDAFWPATLLLYGPRWLIVLPTLVLLPFATARRHRRATLLLLIAGLFIGTACRRPLAVKY
jgi:hypothetical protein